jgi:hypothetical protein
LRFLDLTVLVQKRLKELPYPGYLCAMCIAGEVTISMYGEFLSGYERARAEEVVAVVRDSIRSDDPDLRHRASGLFAEIDKILDHPKFNKTPLVHSMLIMLWLLAGEVSGAVNPGDASDYFGNAISKYSGHVTYPQPGLAEVNVNAEADERSPGVQLTHKFEAVADEISRQLSIGDALPVPEEIQVKIFTQHLLLTRPSRLNA